MHYHPTKSYHVNRSGGLDASSCNPSFMAHFWPRSPGIWRSGLGAAPQCLWLEMTRGAGEKDKTMDGFSFEQNSEEIQKYVLFFFSRGCCYACIHVWGLQNEHASWYPFPQRWFRTDEVRPIADMANLIAILGFTPTRSDWWASDVGTGRLLVKMVT